ncbi:MAG: ferredoxin [Mycobacterium sp.]
MRLVIDLSACAGHGRCYFEASRAVSPDEEGRGIPSHDELPAELLEEAEAAVASCPEYAIYIERP